MKPSAKESAEVLGSTPTVTCRVSFRKGTRQGDGTEERPVVGIPRIVRLLALAHRIDAMIRSGELKNWAEAARLIGISRGRMTQIANLLLLAPEIQDVILKFAPLNRDDPRSECHLRSIPRRINWQKQRHAWLDLKSHVRLYPHCEL